jgi:protein SCO1/2
MNRNTKRRLSGCPRWSALAMLLLGLALVAAGCGAGRSSTPAAKPSTGLHGLVPDPLPHKPSFTLTDTAGRRFNFAAKTRTKLTYLYFGYTHCPNACPLTMADIAAALQKQPGAIQRRVAVVFVTVDPRRDTAHALRAFLDHFDRSFVGLTGSQRAIRTAERAAGIPLAPPEKVKGKNYSIQHSTIVLAYSPDKRAHAVYTQGFYPADYAHDMPLLLQY